uniref:RNA-directed DNA polymerase, eukaryota, reverse transcriptase zinc-binding domain protein n=1 Tax=Tanacetum cinerariifolium TaxID=118510 RepID=A0A699H955_TANCI|nr:RNA-directed DNA polymerase, eukaryota, reverse transcriptase zinc-binding domain protein [Tanacetum cinerariifolium]
MGMYTIKEEDVAKISTSLFITNFPESTSAKELFNACKQYGYVVDTFIPTKRSKAGKRFSFVRFINVFSVERLVNNICMVWLDRFKLHANVARFNRASVNLHNHATQNVGESKSNHNNTAMNDNVAKKDSQSNGLGRTYMHVVKGQVQSGIREEEMSPDLVLDDKCLMSKDVSKCLLGRVKEFASLANLKMVLYNEGFMDIKIPYMGEFWVLMEFVNEKSLKLFRDNVSANSWFSQVIQASLDFVTEGRITDDQYDDEIKNGGINGQETGNDVNSNAEEVPETAVEEKGHEENNVDEESLEKTGDKQFEIPPGYTPIEGSETSGINKEDGTSNNYEKVNEVNLEEFQNLSGNGCSKYSKEVESDFICSGRFKKSKGPKTGGSILNLLDEVVKVGQVMRYKMDGCMSNMVEIIESQGVEEEICVRNKINFLALQETKMENMDIVCVKNYWGNLGFEYVHSDSVGNSGGILCVGDPNSLCKSSVTILDSFVMMRGVWRQSGKDVLLIAVYAPHDFKEKLLLWDYLNRSIRRWNREVIIMGDFNEVRYKSDRFGTVFHTQETLINSCPNISALSLERFYHYWSDLEGFGNVVEAAWKEYPNVEQNAMTNMMGKLKHLKKKIQEWNIKDKQRRSMDKDKYKVDLEALDTIVDQGNGNEEIVKQRSNIVSKLLHIDKLSSVEIAQKAKVKWSIEGDENTSFFHGVINKKHNLLNIRGIMVEGSWVDEPSMVKREFFNHFRNRFDKLGGIRAITHMEYSRRISLDKHSELEGEVSNDEIKRAVWDCGTDKGHGPDGFTFGFYRRFWYLVDNDVYAALKHFFIHGEIPKGFLLGAYIKSSPKFCVLGDIVNEVQSAFVADRQILDGLFILNEVIQWCKSKKKQSLVFKVDFKKAYDSVRWDFLDDILGKFGFCDKWRMWIQSCLKSWRGSIIINGSPMKEFQFFKGLKQGDLLSPFLFILVMESLHLSFQWVEDAEMFKGTKIGPTVTLSHMFYTDDAVFVGKWCESNITTLVHVLDCFHRASGLKINMRKSKILGVHVKSDRVKEAALRLGCLTLKTPFLYLGSKVGGSMSRLHEWDEVVERVKIRLSKWKMKSLSIGGLLRRCMGIRAKIDAEVKIGSRSCWLNIVLEAKILKQKGITLRDFMRIKLGNGENISFWEDCWTEGDSLRNRFPCLYTLESCKRITVGEKMRQPSLEFSFRRNTRGGVEQEQLGDLVTLMHDVSLTPMADRWTWALENSGELTVSSVRKHIDDKLIPGVGSKTRWIKYVPIKVNVNAWKVKLDVLPTRDIEAFVFSCNMVRQTTRMITRWWDVSYEDFVDYDD